MKFAPGSLDALAQQLGEVKTICDVLIRAKVNSLEGVRRERVSPDDLAGPASDYLSERSTTNEMAVLTPYEVTFRCFSPELAAVLAGFANSRHGLVVKSLDVMPASSAATTPFDPMNPYASGAAAPFDPVLSAEALGAARYGLPPQPPAYPTAPASPLQGAPPTVGRYFGETGLEGGVGGGNVIRPPTFTRPTFNTPGSPYDTTQFQPPPPTVAYPPAGYPYGVAPTAAPRGGLPTLIDEQPLQVVMSLTVIRLLPRE